ncbi:MAG TPA: ABC transporter ATP-binding protein [Candidatus Binatus sp.]|nr:ABC transporter ATP-binding protein [Candidatus Binatus sp.]
MRAATWNPCRPAAGILRAQSITGRDKAQWVIGRSTDSRLCARRGSSLANCPAIATSLVMAIVSLRNVSKDYLTDGLRVHALDDVSLEMNRGEFVALVGRSGCGKSTLLNLAGAMDFPSSGRVLLDGVDTSTLKDAGLTLLRREKVGFIFQSFQLLHTLTVFENVELPLLLAGKPDARAAAKEKLAWVELEGLGDRYPHQLSGGQMQRVGIARSLVQSPAILLADEPTGNLDTGTGNLILDLLKRLTRELNIATLMATHSAEAAALSDAIVRLRDGKIEEITRR